MALKLNFKFSRDDFNYGSKQENDEQIKLKLQQILTDKEITASHMYRPSMNSIKVIFPIESEIDKVIKHEEIFKEKNFVPKMSLSLRACRTIFCTHFDRTLLEIYDKNNIIDFLHQQKWKVKDVYIMKSKKSFKIEMSSRKEAQKFLRQESISIGGIKLLEESLGPELDPTISQCWECGDLEPTHNSQNCTGRKICIKCGNTGHKFYECQIPKEIEKMSQQHKEMRYCAACKTRASHTTLDHRLCPKKRDILRERAMVEREKRIAIKEANNKEINLIRKALNFNNTEEWPLPKMLNENPQHAKIATIVTLALLDEAATPGLFERKIQEACRNNGLPEIKYKLEPNTATNFQRTLCGAQTSIDKKRPSTPTTSKYYKDQMRRKRNANYEDKSEEESIEPIMTKEKKPRIIKVNTAQGTSENILNNLQMELEKYIIMIESEENVDKIETKIRTFSMRQLLELIYNNKIINNTEWILLIKKYVEKLIQTGYENTRVKVKLQNVNMESIEISILRANEQERSYVREKEDYNFNESSVSLDDDSEYLNTSQEDNSSITTKADTVDSLLTMLGEKQSENPKDSIDELIDSIIKESSKEDKPNPTAQSERISTYPLDYYVKNGTFSE